MGFNVAILYGDLVAGATVSMTGGTPQTGFPVSNVKTNALFDKVLGPAADYDWSIDIDFGASKVLQAIALLGLNLTDAGTVGILLDDVSSFATPSFNTGDMSFDPAGAYSELGGWRPREGRPFVYLFAHPRSDSAEAAAASKSDRYLRCALKNATSPPAEGWMEASRAWAGPLWTPGKGYHSYTPIDQAERGGLILRRFELGWRMLTPAEHAAIRNLCRALGGHEPIVLVPKDSNAASQVGEVMMATIPEWDTDPWDRTGTWVGFRMVFQEVEY